MNHGVSPSWATAVVSSLLADPVTAIAHLKEIQALNHGCEFNLSLNNDEINPLLRCDRSTSTLCKVIRILFIEVFLVLVIVLSLHMHTP